MATLNHWIQSNQAILWTLGSLSMVLFIGSLLIVPWLVRRIPADYFLGKTRAEYRPRIQHPGLHFMVLIAKNLLGAVLLTAGLAMLLLPGQGLLTLFMGLMLIDFPGKYRMEKRIVRTPVILRSLNWIRLRGRHPVRILNVEPLN